MSKAKAKRMERVKVDSDFVLQHLFSLATADLAEIFEDDGTLKAVSDWPHAFRMLMTGLEVTSQGDATTVKVRFTDRARLIALLGKHVDVSSFEKRVKVDANDNLVAYLEAASRRVKEMRKPPSPGIIDG